MRHVGASRVAVLALGCVPPPDYGVPEVVSKDEYQEVAPLPPWMKRYPEVRAVRVDVIFPGGGEACGVEFRQDLQVGPVGRLTAIAIKPGNIICYNRVNRSSQEILDDLLKGPDRSFLHEWTHLKVAMTQSERFWCAFDEALKEHGLPKADRRYPGQRRDSTPAELVCLPTPTSPYFR